MKALCAQIMSLKYHSKATRRKKVLETRSNELNGVFEFDVKGLKQLVKRLCCWNCRVQFFKFLRIMEPVKEITPSKLITKTSISWIEIKTVHIKIKAGVVEYNFDACCGNIQRFANRFNWVFNIVLISVLSLTKLISSTGDLQLQKTSWVTKTSPEI